ncbi:MAG: sulfite exporter TauE/SafE family protein [Bacteroidota bacterium]
MSWIVLIPGFLLGLVSSFHCIGMCGPVALLLPVSNATTAGKLRAILSYNMGRVVTYVLLGSLLGLLGRRFYIAGFQQIFSIVLGVVILVVLISFILNNRFFHLQPSGILFKPVQKFIAKQMHSQHPLAAFFTGMANGLLPCGMVYFAIVSALATGTMAGGALFMAAFGIGTIPLMLLFGYFGSFVNIHIRKKIQAATPFFIASIGVLLILRGLNLDIPYLSPFFSRISGVAISCH